MFFTFFQRKANYFLFKEEISIKMTKLFLSTDES